MRISKNKQFWMLSLIAIAIYATHGPTGYFQVMMSGFFIAVMAHIILYLFFH